MSDPEGFLTRWSRRKREAAEAERTPSTAAESEPGAQTQAAAPEACEPASTPVASDLSDLPSLDSITGESDISAFLKAGVPGDLRHAALRRAWSADPAIRDFVGLSENAWDFNTPDSVPGFAGLTPSDAVRLAQQLLQGPTDSTVRSDAQDPAFTNASSGQQVCPEAEVTRSEAPECNCEGITNEPVRSAEKPEVDRVIAEDALQQEPASTEPPAELARPHGGALPQ